MHPCDNVSQVWLHVYQQFEMFASHLSKESFSSPNMYVLNKLNMSIRHSQKGVLKTFCENNLNNVGCRIVHLKGQRHLCMIPSQEITRIFPPNSGAPQR